MSVRSEVRLRHWPTAPTLKLTRCPALMVTLSVIVQEQAVGSIKIKDKHSLRDLTPDKTDLHRSGFL